MKRSLKRTGLLVGCLSLLLATGAMAQQTTEQRAERMTQDLKKELNLNDRQTNEVAAINRRTLQEMQQIRENQNLTRRERREQTQQIQDRRTAQIRAVLTEQQRTRFEQHQKVQQKSMKQQQSQQPKKQGYKSKRRGY